jgi:hypothetical protein
LLTDIAAALFAIPAIRANIAKLARPRRKPALYPGQRLQWHGGRNPYQRNEHVTD